MENKKKIYAAVAAIVIVIVLALVFVFAGKDNTTVADTDVVETMSESTVTMDTTTVESESVVEDDIDYLAGIGEAPEDTSGEEVIENETIKDFVDETDKKVEDTKDETTTSESSKSEVSVIEPGIIEEDSKSETKPSVDANLGVKEETKKEETSTSTAPVETITTPPVVDPQPTTPPSSNTGGAEYSGNTITTDTGFVIPLLKDFNSAGMGTDTSFAGSWDSSDGSPLDTMLRTLDAFGVHNDGASNDFLINGNKMQWYPSSANGSPMLELRQCGDHYKLIINGPHLDYATAQATGWAGLSEHYERVSREALLVIASTFSSTPKDVQNAIIASLYTAPNGQEPIGCDGNWYNIGDCKIKLDLDNTNNVDMHLFTFQIRSR